MRSPRGCGHGELLGGAAEAYRKITLQRPPDAEAVADAVEQGASELEETSVGAEG